MALRRITCSNFLVPFADLQTQPIADLDHWFLHQPLAHSLGAFWLKYKVNKGSENQRQDKNMFY
jgi:hypothetical protein